MRKINNYLRIVLGAFILAFAVYNIHNPSGITEGGILGLELLINHWFGISPGISGPTLDIILYLLGTHFFGFDFLKRSIIASILYGLFYELLRFLNPTVVNFNDNLLIAAIIGGLLIGIGAGLVVSTKSAAGGDDSLALILQKYLKLNIAYCYAIADFAVLFLSLTYIPFYNIIYSIITVLISSFTVGFITKYTENYDKNIILKFAKGDYLDQNEQNILIIDNIDSKVYSPISGKIVKLDNCECIIKNYKGNQVTINLLLDENIKTKYYVEQGEIIGAGDTIYKVKQKNYKVKVSFDSLAQNQKLVIFKDKIKVKGI